MVRRKRRWERFRIMLADENPLKGVELKVNKCGNRLSNG